MHTLMNYHTRGPSYTYIYIDHLIHVHTDPPTHFNGGKSLSYVTLTLEKVSTFPRLDDRKCLCMDPTTLDESSWET